jgi:hypothetical protein
MTFSEATATAPGSFISGTTRRTELSLLRGIAVDMYSCDFLVPLAAPSVFGFGEERSILDIVQPGASYINERIELS